MDRNQSQPSISATMKMGASDPIPMTWVATKPTKKIKAASIQHPHGLEPLVAKHPSGLSLDSDMAVASRGFFGERVRVDTRDPDGLMSRPTGCSRAVQTAGKPFVKSASPPCSGGVHVGKGIRAKIPDGVGVSRVRGPVLICGSDSRFTSRFVGHR